MFREQIDMAVLPEVRKDHHAEKRTIWQFLKVALAIGLIALVVSQVSLESVATSWGRISPLWFLASVVVFYACTWLMARRYWILIGRRITFSQLLNVVLLQTVTGNLVATGAGFASYIGILRSKYRVQVKDGLLSIVLARFGDLWALLLALPLASWIVWPQIVTIRVVVMVVISCMMALVVLFSLILLLRKRVVRILGRILHGIHFDRKLFTQRALHTLSALSDQEIDQRGIIIGSFVGYSILILGMMLLFAYCSLQIFAVQIDLWPLIFVVSLTQVIAFLPVQVFGGLGVYDVSYLYFFGLFGIDRSEFAAVIIGLRLFFYVANVVLLLLIPLGTWIHHERHS